MQRVNWRLPSRDAAVFTHNSLAGVSADDNLEPRT